MLKTEQLDWEEVENVIESEMQLIYQIEWMNDLKFQFQTDWNKYVRQWFNLNIFIDSQFKKISSMGLIYFYSPQYQHVDYILKKSCRAILSNTGITTDLITSPQYLWRLGSIIVLKALKFALAIRVIIPFMIALLFSYLKSISPRPA